MELTVPTGKKKRKKQTKKKKREPRGGEGVRGGGEHRVVTYPPQGGVKKMGGRGTPRTR